MDWLTKMNSALDFIEDNLSGEIDFGTVAQKACCSSYNFQRMFSFIADVPLSEYIRRRRLTAAALDLQNSNIKVIDLAVKYGYDSPVSFTRAFESLHGISPTEARRPGATLKAYPKISFQISIKGEKAMDYRIETKEAFDIFGIETISSSIGDEAYLSPAKLWQQCMQNGEYDRLFSNAGELPSFVAQDLCKIHGAVNYRKTGENTFPYMLCAFVNPKCNKEGYTVAHIPSQTYAIFPSQRFRWDEDFSGVLSTLQKRFYSEWLPTANYEKTDGPEFEIYGGTEDLGYIELWYPITKK